MVLDSTHIEALSQCLGFDKTKIENGVFRTQKNFSLHTSVHPTFESLVEMGYVNKSYCCNMINYCLTSMGVSFMEDTFHCKIEIYKENKEDY